MSIDLSKLSKLVSHALRHEPEIYNLKLDNEGWTSISELILGLKHKGFDVNQHMLIEMIEKSEKKRHEIVGDKIRAYYGHSTEEKISKKPEEPPCILYHGTSQTNLDAISDLGLLPMKRQYVHLSIDELTAQTVAKRRKGKISILKIKAKDAFDNGIVFYKEENGVWLSEPIPSKYIF